MTVYASESYRHPGVVERNFGALNGNAYVEVVPAPGEGRIYQVTAVTMPNTTVGALIANLAIKDGIAGTTSVLDYVGVVAAATTYSSAINLPVILLRDFDSLVMQTTAAATPTFYAVWSILNTSLMAGSF